LDALRRLVDAGFAPEDVRVVGDPAIDSLLRRIKQPDDRVRSACRAAFTIGPASARGLGSEV